MQLRREAGNRVVNSSRYERREGGAGYLIAHACFTCRKSFKREPREESLFCPDCGAKAYAMGRAFTTPARSARDEWKKVRLLYAYGFRFHGYGSDAPPYPESWREVEAFAQANPQHPYRVGAIDTGLLLER